MGSEPSRETLLVDGSPVLSYLLFDQGQQTADDALPMADLGVVVREVRAQMAGSWFSSPDDELTDALLADGATVVRHVQVMTCDVSGAIGPGPARSVPIVPIRGSSAQLAELSVRAYPPGHVDFDTSDAAEAQRPIDAMLGGTLIGSFMESASGMVTEDDRPVAVLVINRMPDHVTGGGPWVTEIFRDPNPAYRGFGTALLDRAIRILRSEGETSLSLAVTAGNPAREVYRRHGFELVASSRKLLIPVD